MFGVAEISVDGNQRVWAGAGGVAVGVEIRTGGGAPTAGWKKSFMKSFDQVGIKTTECSSLRHVQRIGEAGWKNMFSGRKQVEDMTEMQIRVYSHLIKV